MGRASKWIRNFLMGKREDKGKGKNADPVVPAETCTSLVNNTPNAVRRRWSFKRSTTTKPAAISHKTTGSFDSFLMPKQALLEGYQARQNNAMPPLVLHAHAAATKIQAIYRSYLARRALCALRGLVKLQALARGHLVRKQMNTVIRSMHAVMAIQVRARIHRIQMAEDPPLMLAARKSSALGNSFPMSGGLRSRSGRIDHTPAARVENNSRMCTSGRLSVSRREYQPKMCPSPSALSLTDSSSTTFDEQLEEYSLEMAQRNSRRYSAFPENKHPFIQSPAPAKCVYYVPTESDYSHFIPNYMTNTKSSKAKARSHSEPRQRPKSGTRQKSRRSSSMDGKNDKESQFPWLIKLYRSDKSNNDGDCDSNISALTSISKYTRSSIPIEPPMNLY